MRKRRWGVMRVVGRGFCPGDGALGMLRPIACRRLHAWAGGVQPPGAPPLAHATPAPLPACSNPSNWMWRILRDTGLAPAAAIRGAEDDGKMPAVAGGGPVPGGV